MANQGAVGKTAILAFVDATTNTTAFGNINSIGIPEASADAADITSSSGGTNAPAHKSFLAGLVDGGEFDVELTYAASAMPEILNNIGTSDKKFRITFPETSDGAGSTAVTATFTTYGFISGHGGAIPMNDKITQTFRIKCSGGPTFATS